MNEKLQYADMLEIPVSTTSITYKKIKRTRKNKEKPTTEDIKNQLIEKVNSPLEQTQEELVNQEENSAIEQTEVSKKRKVFSFVSLQLCIIGMLVAVILVSTAVNPNSGINVFFNQVFGTSQNQTTVDERTFEEFAPVFSIDGTGLEYVVEEGTTTVTGSGSVYCPVSGIVEAVTLDGEGKYSITVSHSENFSSIISGLTYCYAQVGEQVKQKIPVGFSTEKTYNLCFLDGNDAVLTGYQIVDNQVVWGV